jgi:hypothetical protein
VPGEARGAQLGARREERAKLLAAELNSRTRVKRGEPVELGAVGTQGVRRAPGVLELLEIRVGELRDARPGGFV